MIVAYVEDCTDDNGNNYYETVSPSLILNDST